jgi:sporulation protein YlmC with PRC-barrel domain
MSLCRNGFLIGLALAYFLQVCAAADRPGHSELQKSRFTNIRGMHVENKDGERLGEIKDFVIDLETGQVKFAIIKSRGFINFEAPPKIVPARLISNATIKKRTLEIDLSLQRLKNGPSFKKSEIASLREPHRFREILAYYYGSGFRAPADWTSSFTSSGTTSRNKKMLQLANEIQGWQVFNHRHDEIGKVIDVLIDLSWEKPVLGIVSKKGLLKRSPELAVPLNALEVIGPRALAMKTGHVTTETAPWLSERDWHALQTNAVTLYRFDD